MHAVLAETALCVAIFAKYVVSIASINNKNMCGEQLESYLNTYQDDVGHFCAAELQLLVSRCLGEVFVQEGACVRSCFCSKVLVQLGACVTDSCRQHVIDSG